LEQVLVVYGRDFHSNGTRLKAQLFMLPQLISEHHELSQMKTMADFIARLTELPKENLNLFGEVVKLIQLLLVCSAVATAERSFSDHRRLKTWLRASIYQPTFTNLALLHCHQERLDAHTEHIVKTVVSDFVTKTPESKMHSKQNVPVLRTTSSSLRCPRSVSRRGIALPPRL